MVLFIALMVGAVPRVQAAPNEEEPCQRLVLTLLNPVIQAEVNKYYSNLLTYLPTVAPFLPSNELTYTYHQSRIDVTVTVHLYVGPHLSAGKDRIRLTVSNTSQVDVVSYEHLADYELPPNWANIRK